MEFCYQQTTWQQLKQKAYSFPRAVFLQTVYQISDLSFFNFINYGSALIPILLQPFKSGTRPFVRSIFRKKNLEVSMSLNVIFWNVTRCLDCVTKLKVELMEIFFKKTAILKKIKPCAFCII